MSLTLADFDFELPQDRIALRPAQPRDAARLLVVEPAAPLQDRVVADLPDLLRAGDLLVVNDTRVIPARLTGLRRRGEQAGARGSHPASAAWAGALERVRPPRQTSPPRRPDQLRRGGERRPAGWTAWTRSWRPRGRAGRSRSASNSRAPPLDQAVALHGVMPLPPYIAAQRAEDERDRSDYQTVYARAEGSVAAPTAGLHFTPELLDRLARRGVGLERVTLHVGGGTFLPVKTESLAEHAMHAEYGEVSPETAAAVNAARAAGGRIVCVGTTSLRLLESAALPDGTVQPFAAETAIFITPGYRFRVADLLLTNFHLPRSTLFMLVSAFSGLETMRSAYAHAIATGYRFYSYGDASLLVRAD
jgi:S-adenosylmethionine:tRNA ribosyltransferase-isomerase